MHDMIIPGTRVTGSDWNDIGEVKYLVLIPNSAEITGLVVKTNTFDESCKLIRAEQVARVLDDGKFITLSLTREEVEILPVFNRNKYIGIGELSRAVNPAPYNNNRVNDFALSPSEVYLYPLEMALKILEVSSLSQEQSRVF